MAKKGLEQTSSKGATAGFFLSSLFHFLLLIIPFKFCNCPVMDKEREGGRKVRNHGRRRPHTLPAGSATATQLPSPTPGGPRRELFKRGEERRGACWG